MDHQSATTRRDLECMLCDENAAPEALPLSLLEEITNGFSDTQEIGRGGFAVVYKGTLKNGVVIAVKRLSKTHIFEKEFHREVQCLIKVKHKNVIRFIGYCANSQGKAVTYNGQFLMADVLQRLLCFEYLPHGTLEKHITDASHGLDWSKRYKIISGICEGLHYLHQIQIVHLDLKPQNILLDGNMLPKIADFGLSRCFNEQQTRVITTSIGGTIGYLAPEFGSHEITYRFDLYSLGVIIMEMLTGKRGYEAVEDVTESWRNMLDKSQRDIQLEQVRVCAQIAIECIEYNPAKRPPTHDIIQRLHKTASTDMTGSLALQVETTSCEQHEGALKVPGETSSEDFSPPGSSFFLLDQTTSAQVSEVVLLAVRKIDHIFRNEAAKAIIAQVSKKVTNLKQLQVKVEKIRSQLTMMSNVIRQIGPVYLDDVVKSWIGQVRKVAFRVEDVMDKYVYHVLQLQREGFLKKLFIKGTHYVQDFNKIVNEVVLIEEEIQLVIQIKEECLQPAQLVRITEMERQRSRNSLPEFVKDEDVIGFESNRILLTGWLYSEEPESTVITVSGMGGLGKSTLVSNVYERQKINFPAHAWITVSQIYTVDILLRELLWKIGYTEQPLSAGIDKMTVYDLRMEIQQRLKNIKCLIILDDVWAQEVYFQIQGAFQNLQGSRIIITTRNCHVAAVSSPTRHLELEPLSHDDSFDLLCRRAFYNKKGHMCPDELRRIADQIIGKCWGQPLAIVTIGSMLSSTQRLDFWEQTYNRLRSELSRNDQVRAILSKSYHDLSGDLRNCFLYCSLFPEDYIISRETLVRLWVAEGFVLRNENNTPEEVAERNLMELIHRNMLKVVENCELGGVKSCVMHPIVRDLAISVAKEVRFSTTDDHGTLIQMDKDVRRVSILWKQNTMQKLKLPHLRTVVTREEKSYHISSNCRLSWILSASCYLTVLKIQDSEVTEVPASIGHLFNLRYISLRRSKVNSLPNSIENLYNLQTLDVRETNIVNLPQGIVKIKKLRHLLADRYAHRTEFPYSVRPQAPEDEFPYSVGVQAPEELSNMEELQTLETLNSSKDLEKQLRPLRQLRSVCIDNIRAADCENLFITLSERPLLSSLLLSARDENEALCFEELMPREPNVLRRLIIRGQWAKGTLDCPIFVHYGRWLKYLWLSWCHIGEDPVGLLAPHMPNLTFLRLSDMHSANTLVISSESFPNLKTLVLNHMPDVSELNIIDGALPCIEGLYIEWLPKLTKVPQGIKSLRSLKKLRLISLNCSFASQWKTNEMSAKMRHVRDVDVY